MSTIYKSGSTCANIDTLNFLKIARWWLQSLSFQEFQGLAPQLSRIPQQAVETLCSEEQLQISPPETGWRTSFVWMLMMSMLMHLSVSLDTEWLLNIVELYPKFSTNLCWLGFHGRSGSRPTGKHGHFVRGPWNMQHLWLRVAAFGPLQNHPQHHQRGSLNSRWKSSKCSKCSKIWRMS